MSAELFSLKGKVAAVTGCTKGIGRGLAIALAEAGADICLLQRNLDDKNVYDEIVKLGRKCEQVYLDVSDNESCKTCIDRVLEKFPHLDILVNNAGITRRSPAVDFTEEDWDAVIQCDLKSMFTLCQAAGRHMISRKSGKIINTASLMSYQGGINIVAYASAKGGVAMLTKALSNEWAQHNVQVNAIAPGYVMTELTAALANDEKRYQQILERIPAQRWANPDDFKGPVVFLASQASNYVTGELLAVDGGWLAR